MSNNEPYLRIEIEILNQNFLNSQRSDLIFNTLLLAEFGVRSFFFWQAFIELFFGDVVTT